MVIALGIWSRNNKDIQLGFNPEDSMIVYLLLSLVVPLYTIIISQQISVVPDLKAIEDNTIAMRNSTDTIKKDSKRIKRNVLKAVATGRLIYMGNPETAAKAVLKRLKCSTNVLNTYIASNRPPYTSKTEKLILNGIVEFISRKDTSFEDTYSNMSKSRIDEIKEVLGELPPSYQVQVLKPEFNGMPVCNFIVLGDDTSSTEYNEVFFGWGYFTDKARESVLWSNDQHLIGFFRGYHAALRTEKVSERYV